jgi:hypothetical protein
VTNGNESGCEIGQWWLEHLLQIVGKMVGECSRVVGGAQ